MSTVQVMYVGKKEHKHDNVANTGLTWLKGETKTVSAEAAAKLLKHPDIWVNPENFDPNSHAHAHLAPAETSAAEHLKALLESDKIHIVVIDRETLDAIRAGEKVFAIHGKATPAQEAQIGQTTSKPAPAPVPLATAANKPAGEKPAGEGGADPAAAGEAWDFANLTKNQIALRLKKDFNVDVDPDKYNKAELVEYVAGVIASKQKAA